MTRSKRFLVPFVGAALAFVSLSGCIVEERPYVARPAPPCPGAMWVGGHYGPRGRWHYGHWRCPGVVEVIEVD
jgi:hypothetical protein